MNGVTRGSWKPGADAEEEEDLEARTACSPEDTSTCPSIKEVLLAVGVWVLVKGIAVLLVWLMRRENK